MARILTFAGFYSPHIGGAEILIHDVLSRMVLEGYEVDLVTCNTERVSRHEIVDGIEIWRIPCCNLLQGTYPVPLPVPDTFRTIWHIFRKKQDIVFTYCRFYQSTFLGTLISKLKRVPLIHIELGSSHSVTNKKSVKFVSEFYDHTMGAIVVKSATKLLAISGASAKFLEHLGGKNIIIIKPAAGINMGIFKKAPNSLKMRLGINDSIIITSVSRLIFAKGIHDLIAAFSLINKQIPHSTLIIVGDGPYKSVLTEQAKEIGQGNILFLGEINAVGVAEVLNITDVFVNPSYSEGDISYPVIEAGAIGVPSVITDAGGTREIVEDGKTALIVKIGDVTAIAAKVCELVQNESLRKYIGQNISQLVQEDFDWDDIFPLYLQEFKAFSNREKNEIPNKEK